MQAAASEEEPPSAAVVPAASAAPAAAAAAPQPTIIKDASLPEGWSSAVDPTYNHVYYFNVSTGQRIWEKPAAAPKSAPAEPPAQVRLFVNLLGMRPKHV